MKKALQAEVARLAETLSRISNMAKLLPEDGPAPTFVSPVLDGEIHFNGRYDNATSIIQKAFGGTAWLPEHHRHGGYIDYVKKLPNGVIIRIEYAEEPSINGVHANK